MRGLRAATPPAGARRQAGAGVAGSIASLAFLTDVPGQPGTGYAALRVTTDVTRLTVGLRDGGTLTLRPVPVRACARWLPLAGFKLPRVPGWPAITAYAGARGADQGHPHASLFTGAGSLRRTRHSGLGVFMLRLVPGVWQQLCRTRSNAVASGVVASGRLDGDAVADLGPARRGR